MKKFVTCVTLAAFCASLTGCAPQLAQPTVGYPAAPAPYAVPAPAPYGRPVAAAPVAYQSGPAYTTAPGNAAIQNAGIGAVAGAALGAAVNKKNRLAGAGIGAAGGALVGGLMGQQMDRNNANYMAQQGYGAPAPQSY